MRHTARAGGMRVRSGRRERDGPFARETSPRGSIPIPPVWGEGPRLLGRPVGQRVLPGLWNPAGRGMPAGIVHIVGPRCGGNSNPTALIPTGLAPRPSLHGFCLTAKKSCWMAVTECSLMTPTDAHMPVPMLRLAGRLGSLHRCQAGAGPAHQQQQQRTSGGRAVSGAAGRRRIGRNQLGGRESWARLSVRHPDPATSSSSSSCPGLLRPNHLMHAPGTLFSVLTSKQYPSTHPSISDS